MTATATRTHRSAAVYGVSVALRPGQVGVTTGHVPEGFACATNLYKV
jgi:hypothetical protein